MAEYRSFEDIAATGFGPLQQRQEGVSQQRAVEDRNDLLDGLDRECRNLVEPHLEHVSLAPGQVLEKQGQWASFLYFPIKGAIGLQATSHQASMQVALVGRESLVGASLLLGCPGLHRAVVQFEGTATGLSLPRSTPA